MGSKCVEEVGEEAFRIKNTSKDETKAEKVEGGNRSYTLGNRVGRDRRKTIQ